VSTLWIFYISRGFFVVRVKRRTNLFLGVCEPLAFDLGSDRGVLAAVTLRHTRTFSTHAVLAFFECELTFVPGRTSPTPAHGFPQLVVKGPKPDKKGSLYPFTICAAYRTPCFRACLPAQRR